VFKFVQSKAAPLQVLVRNLSLPLSLVEALH
jgi:hypothetical protein